MAADGAFTILVDESDRGRRLDAVAAAHLPDCSRSLVANLIVGGKILVGGRVKKPGYRVKSGDEILGQIPEPEQVENEPQPIPLSILYQDRDILVLNKQAGLVVHPAPGHSNGTLVNAVLFHCPDLGGIGGEIRPGIVHRLDKGTSGTMVVAKNANALENLAKQFKARSIQKQYLALVYGELRETEGSIKLPIGRHPVHRKRMSTTTRKGRTAETFWCVRERFQGITLLELTLKTGRTHQIRAHCAAIDHPIVGDPIYRPRKLLNHLNKRLSNLSPLTIRLLKMIPRQMLHAWRLGFTHPRSGADLTYESPLPQDMDELMGKLRCGDG
ncbi:MAG: RluA family pseudouridine synthase [Desulfobacterales bacterium]|nr:RluA family pseudouridine synthase [Desulfobacterales bacterium]